MISVIVPIYNVEKYLEECLLSIQNQTYSNFECIMVNDGSPDSSADIAQSFVDNDSRFKLVHRENGGLSAARNTGLSHAQGDFITFVDSDDCIKSDMLEVLMTYLANDVDIVECKYDADKKFLTESTSNKEKVIFKGREKGALNALVVEKKLNHIACAKLYKKELFSELLFPEGLLYEDLYMYMIMLKKVKNIIKLDYCGYYYRQNTVSIMRTEFREKNLDIFSICNLIEENYKDAEELHPLVYRHLFSCLVYHYLNFVDYSNPYKEKYEEYLGRYSKKSLNSGVTIKLYKLSPKNFKRNMALISKFKGILKRQKVGS